MRNVIAFVLAVTLSLAASAPVSASDAGMAVAALDRASQKELGIPLRALGMLLDAQKGGFLLKQALVEDGTWPLVALLQKAGYVTVRIVGSPSSEYVELTPTEKGCAVQAALQGR